MQDHSTASEISKVRVSYSCVSCVCQPAAFFSFPLAILLSHQNSVEAQTTTRGNCMMSPPAIDARNKLKDKTAQCCRACSCATEFERTRFRTCSAVPKRPHVRARAGWSPRESFPRIRPPQRVGCAGRGDVAIAGLGADTRCSIQATASPGSTKRQRSNSRAVTGCGRLPAARADSCRAAIRPATPGGGPAGRLRFVTQS